MDVMTVIREIIGQDIKNTLQALVDMTSGQEITPKSPKFIDNSSQDIILIPTNNWQNLVDVDDHQPLSPQETYFKYMLVIVL